MEKSWLKKLNSNLGDAMPPGTNIARTLSTVLNVSPEGVYRRLRGQTSFTLDELLLMRMEFGISIDAILDAGEAVSVRMTSLFDGHVSLNAYLNNLHLEFTTYLRQNATLHCLAADIPFFRLLGYENLTAFKLFYWQKSILQLDHFKNDSFALQSVVKEDLNLCNRIANQYRNCDSVEVWNEQTINGTLKQIEYYADCAFFVDEGELWHVYRDLLSLILDVSAEAQGGNKTSMKGAEGKEYELWNCELVLDNNTVLIESTNESVLAIGFNSFNAFRCVHPTMISEYKLWLNSMISKSIMLSGQADKHRISFIQENIRKISHSAKTRLSNALYVKLLELGRVSTTG